MLHFEGEVEISMNTLMGELVSLQQFAFTSLIFNVIILLLWVFLTVLMHCLFFAMFLIVAVHMYRCL